jgi:hypothetical protein
MTVRYINIGNVANDGTGDDLREAFDKVNQTFEYLDSKVEESTSARNLTEDGFPVFSGINEYELQFKTIVEGNNIVIVPSNETIQINASIGLETVLISADTGDDVLLSNNAVIRVTGGNKITTSSSPGEIVINYTGASSLSEDPAPLLNGSLDANGNNIDNVDVLTANTVNSDLIGLVHGIDIRTINSYFDENFDFGQIIPTANSIIDWIIASYVVDFGSFTQPSSISVAMGGF